MISLLAASALQSPLTLRNAELTVTLSPTGSLQTLTDGDTTIAAAGDSWVRRLPPFARPG